MTRKQFSVWMLAGCIGAGSTFGATVSAEQLDGEMGYYDTGEGYWDNAYQGDSVQEDTYTTYEDQTYAPQPAEEYYSETEAWTPDSTEYYDSNVVTEEEASEEKLITIIRMIRIFLSARQIVLKRQRTSIF